MYVFSCFSKKNKVWIPIGSMSGYQSIGGSQDLQYLEILEPQRCWRGKEVTVGIVFETASRVKYESRSQELKGIFLWKFQLMMDRDTKQV